MFTSVLNSAEGSLAIQNGVLCSLVSLTLGFLIAFIYGFQGACSKNFMMTLVMLPVLVQMVIMLVNGNLGTSVAVLGAFSLVRFRSVPGTSKEMAVIMQNQRQRFGFIQLRHFCRIQVSLPLLHHPNSVFIAL